MGRAAGECRAPQAAAAVHAAAGARQDGAGNAAGATLDQWIVFDTGLVFALSTPAPSKDDITK